MSGKLRIIHAADFHLGSPFSTLSSDKAGIRRAEQQDTFRSMIRLCEEQHTQVLLIAGDLLDDGKISEEQRRLLVQEFQRIPATRIFISPGNHDPYMKYSAYESMQWPENVHIFSGDLEPVYCRELNTVIWGAAFRSPRQTKTLCPEGFHISMFDQATPETVHLIVMHGVLFGGKQKDSYYNPISPDWIEKCGAEYVALGHVHDPSPVSRIGRTYYSYAGCPEARGYDEAGPRGVYAGTVEKGRVNLSYIYLNRRNFYTLNVPVDECGTQVELFERVKQYLQEKFPDDFSDSAFRLSLTGGLPQDFTPNTASLKKKLAELCFDVRVYDKTAVMFSPEQLREEKSLRGVFVKTLLAQREKAVSDGDDEKLSTTDLAMKLGLRAFEGEVQYHEDI